MDPTLLATAAAIVSGVVANLVGIGVQRWLDGRRRPGPSETDGKS